MCKRFLPLMLDVLTGEFGALIVRIVLVVPTERSDDLDCVWRSGDRGGIGRGGGGGIGIAGTLVLVGPAFSTSETIDLFLRIGFSTGIV